MVTHSKEYRVLTSVIVPVLDRGNGAWGSCPELPDVLGESIIRSCDDLRVIVESQGGVVARLVHAIEKYSGFRLLAREGRTHALAGSVEWVRNAAGLWVQWDEPVTVCAYGDHGPTVTVRLAA